MTAVRLAVGDRAGLRLLEAALGTAALCVAVGVVASPLLTVAALVAVMFVTLAFRNLALALALFTILTFFDRVTSLQSGGLTPVKAAGAVLAVAWLLSILAREGAPVLVEAHPLVAGCATALVVWTAGSSAWATDPDRSVSSGFRLLQGVVLVFVVYSAVRERHHVRWLMWGFMVGALLAAVLGVAGVYESASVNEGRASGGFDDPNELAAVLVPATVFAGFGFLATRSFALRALYVCCALVYGIAIARSDSQAGLVALGVAVLLAVLFSGDRARKVVAVAACVLVAAGSVYYTAVTTPVAFQTISSTGNTSNRKSLWAVAASIAQEHPVVGIGAGNFPVVEPAYALGNITLTRADLVLEGELVHNTYLEVLAELGAVGLVLFLVVIGGSLSSGILAVRRFERRGDRELELLGRAFVVGTAALLTAYAFATNTYEKQLWLLVGAGLALLSVARRSAPEEGR